MYSYIIGGPPGDNGRLGRPGLTGAQGPQGSQGSQGTAGGAIGFAAYYALMPPDNAATVAPGAPVLFPNDGPNSGIAVRTGPGLFTIQPGTYEFNWQVSVSEAGQLQLSLGGAPSPISVVGRATGTSQLVGTEIQVIGVTLTVALINPAGNSTALTITPTAGGTHAVSAWINIKKLA